MAPAQSDEEKDFIRFNGFEIDYDPVQDIVGASMGSIQQTQSVSMSWQAVITATSDDSENDGIGKTALDIRNGITKMLEEQMHEFGSGYDNYNHTGLSVEQMDGDQAGRRWRLIFTAMISNQF